LRAGSRVACGLHANTCDGHVTVGGMTRMLQVRNVPDDVHARLKERAKAAGMSMSEYVLRELKELVDKPSLDEIWRRAEARDSSVSLADAAQLIRDERDARS
jgi:antitoxin FitA